MFRRLIGQNLDTSSLFCFFFQVLKLVSVLLFSTSLGRLPFLDTHYTRLLYNWGRIQKYFYKSHPLFLFSWRFFIPHTFYSISDFFYSKIYAVSHVHRFLRLCLPCVWKSVSSLYLSSGTKYSSKCCKVSLISTVSDPSGFLSVVSFVLFLLFPTANLYTSFQGLVDDIMLEYSFH
jgi:hypothetical protein